MKHFTLNLRWLIMSLVLCGNLSALGAPKTGTIIFGSNDTKINSASVTGDDNFGNTWTITTVGTTSFSQHGDCSQVGSSNKPATSITFTMTLDKDKTANIQSLSAKFGGYTDTAGNITLKIDGATVGTGSLNGTNDVTVSSTQSKQGKTITVTVTGIAKGVKCYNISYTYEESTECYTVTLDDENETLTETQPGSGVTLPSREDVEDYKFYGWTTTDIPEETTNAPASIIPAGNYYPESNITLYPVYRRSENGSFAEPVTVSTTIQAYATNNHWNDANQYTTVELDNVITANVPEGGNTGKYYTNGNDWRLYQSDEAKLTIAAADNFLITAAIITFTNKNNGTLIYNGSELESEEEISVSGANSIEFSVGNSTSAKNGQIRISEISVTYKTDVKIYYTSHPVVPQTAEVAISSVEYRTYVIPFDVDFTQTAGLTAYVVESAERGENGIKYVEVTSVPANTPVILNGTEGTYTIHEGEYTGEEITNVLKTGPVTVNDDNYGTIFVLNTGTNGVGFYLLNNGKTLSEGKCYLEIPKNGTDDGAKFVGFHIGDATGISSVVNPTAERNVVYNLAGQRVAAPTKGLYIVNGKKVFIK